MNIFIGMGKVSLFQNRRIWRKDGIYYFCGLCGDYKIESDFYKSKHTPFGITYKCKIHYRSNKGGETDSSMDYLSLTSLKDSDLEETQLVLERLGYKFGPDQLPVWRQFEIRHGIKTTE